MGCLPHVPMGIGIEPVTLRCAEPIFPFPILTWDAPSPSGFRAPTVFSSQGGHPSLLCVPRIKNVSPVHAYRDFCLAVVGKKTLTHLILEGSAHCDHMLLLLLCEALKHRRCHLRHLRCVAARSMPGAWRGPRHLVYFSCHCHRCALSCVLSCWLSTGHRAASDDAPHGGGVSASTRSPAGGARGVMSLRQQETRRCLGHPLG